MMGWKLAAAFGTITRETADGSCVSYPPLRTPAALCLLACSECLLCVLTPHVMNWGIMDPVWGVCTHDKAHKMSISAGSQPFIHTLFILFIFVGHNYFWHGVNWRELWCKTINCILIGLLTGPIALSSGSWVVSHFVFGRGIACYCSVQTQSLIAVLYPAKQLNPTLPMEEPWRLEVNS